MKNNVAKKFHGDWGQSSDRVESNDIDNTENIHNDKFPDRS